MTKSFRVNSHVNYCKSQEWNNIDPSIKNTVWMEVRMHKFFKKVFQRFILRNSYAWGIEWKNIYVIERRE